MTDDRQHPCLLPPSSRRARATHFGQERRPTYVASPSMDNESHTIFGRDGIDAPIAPPPLQLILAAMTRILKSQPPGNSWTGSKRGAVWGELGHRGSEIAFRVYFFNTSGVGGNSARSVRYLSGAPGREAYGSGAGSGSANCCAPASLFGVGLLGNKCSVKSAW